MFSSLVWEAYELCWRSWYALHVEHKGGYSLERLQQLHQFLRTRKAIFSFSLLDLATAIATPLPCLAIALVSDALPLAPPEDGPRANGVFWARSWLVMGSFTLAVLLPMHHRSISPIPERRVWLGIMSATISAIHTGIYFTLALMLGFPIPFSYLTLNIVWTSLIVAGLWIYMGPAHRASASVRHQLKLHAIFICAASSLAVVYPLFYYAFLRARKRASAQLLLTFTLPIVKMMEKLLLYRVTTHIPDLQPVFITFNVEVFNALFVSSCMRNATSMGVTIALMVADFFGACVALYGLRNLMHHIDKLSAKMSSKITRAHLIDVSALIVSHHHPDRLAARHGHDDLPQSNATSVAEPWIVRDQADEFISNANSDGKGIHVAKDAEINQPGSPSKIAWVKKVLSFKHNAVAPAETTLSSPFYHGSSVENMDTYGISVQTIEQLSLEERQQLVHETCRVLRRVEFLLLVEYTEVMVPVVYAIYIAIVYQLPNRKYFPYLNEMSEADLTSTVQGVLIYGSLQLTSFVLLLVVLIRRFKLPSGALLRFVLHNEWRIVQSHFVLWIIYILQSSIQHIGTDYTFRFVWLHK